SRAGGRGDAWRPHREDRARAGADRPDAPTRGDPPGDERLGGDSRLRDRAIRRHLGGRRGRAQGRHVRDGGRDRPRDERGVRRLAHSLVRLDDGGVVLNLGSAVIMPEVFLKALTIARNLHDGRPQSFTSVDLDMQRHYRPRMNVVQRPTLQSGKGYEITGHHEIMVPLLAWAVVERLSASGAESDAHA